MPVPDERSSKAANMYCSISGTIPSEPVVSIRSGHLYDRPLIEKVLSANGNKCPETGEPLTKEDLLPVKTGGTVAPMPPEKSSVPGVLQYVKDEWDRLTVELHGVKKELHQTRQELATALYRYDVAVKVIAKLEREAAQQPREVRQVDKQGDEPEAETPKQKPLNKEKAISESAPAESDSDKSRLPPGLVELAKKNGEQLQAARKARKPSGVPSADVIGSFSESGRVAADGDDVAVTSLGVAGDRVYAGCSSGKMHCVEGMKVSRSVSAHEGGVTSVWCGDWDRVLTGGRDGCVRVWDDEMGERAVFEGRSGVVDVERHGIGLLFCCHEDGFVWRDQDTGAVVAAGDEKGVSCGALHPDGMVFATGGRGVGMWDVGTMTMVARLGEESVGDIVMSEKGYYLICCDGEGVKVWDLRKQQVVGSMGIDGAAGVAVDRFGEYGCVTGREGVGFFVAKKKANRIALVDVEADKSEGRRGVAWGKDCAIVGCGNGVVRWYKSPST